jgi:hypothetical protein
MCAGIDQTFREEAKSGIFKNRLDEKCQRAVALSIDWSC